MKKTLSTLACCLCLIALSAPALFTAEAEAPAASPAALDLGPYDALPLQQPAQCGEDEYFALEPIPNQGACKKYCEDTGGTFAYYVNIRHSDICACCPV